MLGLTSRFDTPFLHFPQFLEFFHVFFPNSSFASNLHRWCEYPVQGTENDRTIDARSTKAHNARKASQIQYILSCVEATSLSYRTTTTLETTHTHSITLHTQMMMMIEPSQNTFIIMWTGERDFTISSFRRRCYSGLRSLCVRDYRIRCVFPHKYIFRGIFLPIPARSFRSFRRCF